MDEITLSFGLKKKPWHLIKKEPRILLVFAMMSSKMTTYQEAFQEPQLQPSLKSNEFYYTTTSNPAFHEGTAGHAWTSLQQPHRHSHSFPQAMNSHDRLNRSQSASIPIAPNAMRRTASENQLSEDEAEADYKDYLFYNRLVNGISSKQRFLQDGLLKHENQQCLENIVRTRHDEDMAAAAASDYYWYHPAKDYHPSSLREADRLVHARNIASEALLVAVPAREQGSSSVHIDEECIFDLEL
jgi:hypothetical protein